MKKFKVIIEETISQEFEVEAENFESAEDIATEKYYKGEFVLEPGEVDYKQMSIIDDETQEQTSWFDF
jgi:hypothetical protein